MITRIVTNAGDPLVNGGGALQIGVKISFTLVDAKGNPSGAWDVLGGDHITPGPVVVFTDAYGLFSVALWPTSRADRVVFWKCDVDLPFIPSFKNPLIDVAGSLQWFDFRFGSDSSQGWPGDIGPAIGQAIAGAAVAYVPRVSSVESRVAAVEAGQGSGVVGYATQAALFADLVPADKTVAYVTNDSTAANNGAYRKSGATGAGSWIQSSSDRVAILENQVTADKYLAFAQTAPKIKTDRNTTGEIFVGAQWFDGIGTSGTAPTSGGWIIPAGASGPGTYNRYKWAINAILAATMAGRTVRFEVELNTSPDLVANPAIFTIGTQAIGTVGAFANPRLAAVDTNHAIFTFDYTFTGGETEVNAYLQYGPSSTTGADRSLFAKAQYYAPLDGGGFADATESIIEDLFTPHDEKTTIDFEAAAFNGGVIEPTGFSIPAGQTGVSTYVKYFIPLERELMNSGKTVVFRLEATTNDFLLSPGFALQGGIDCNVDGAADTTVEETGTINIIQKSPNLAIVTGEYILRGGLKESAGLWVQVSGSAAVGYAREFLVFRASYSIKTETKFNNAENRIVDDLKLSSGDLRGLVSPSGENLGGSVFVDNGFGLSIPTGQTGVSAYLRYNFDASKIALFAGSVIRNRLLLKTSANATAETNVDGGLSVYYSDRAPAYNTYKTREIKVLSPTLISIETTYKIIGTETTLAPYVQIGGSSARTTDATINYDNLRFIFESQGYTPGSPETQGYSPAEQILAFRESRVLEGNPVKVTYSKTINVKPDGSGDYLTLAAAIAAEGAGTSENIRLLYRVWEGVYTDIDYSIPKFVDVVGIGQSGRIWLSGALPDNVAVTTIPLKSTIWLNETARLANLKITAKNMRYPIHSDSGPSTNRALIEAVDCYVEHLGNEGARAYQTSIAADPSAVWASEHAFGCGTHSGERIFSRRTKWVSRTSAFYFHTSADFAEPSYIEFEESAAICTTDTGVAVSIQPLGSGQPDRFVIRNSEIRGLLSVYPAPWLSNQLYNQRGNQNSEVEVFISGSSPVAWVSTNAANVLELRSIDSSSSAVFVSGTGADALFGTQPEVVAGGVGYPARARSSFAVTGTVGGISLGSRLGNCTSANKTLSILFDGSINKTITLNQNYSAMTNAAVVSALNVALADGTRAFYELNPYNNAPHIIQPDREVEILNTGSTSILKGMIVALDTSQYKGRVATSADPKTLLAGVALEVIVPGARGRVLKPGAQMAHDQILFDGAPTFSFGDTFGVSSTPGLVIEGAATPFLKIVEIRTSAIFEIIQ